MLDVLGPLRLEGPAELARLWSRLISRSIQDLLCRKGLRRDCLKNWWRRWQGTSGCVQAMRTSRLGKPIHSFEMFLLCACGLHFILENL